jgi:hypothetical protein
MILHESQELLRMQLLYIYINILIYFIYKKNYNNFYYP